MAVIILVYHHHGGEETCSETGNRFVCKTQIVGSLARLNASFLLYGISDLRASFDVAGGSAAESDRMTAVRLEMKLFVKSGYSVNPAESNTGASAHFHYNIAWKITVCLLDLLQNWNEVV